MKTRALYFVTLCVLLVSCRTSTNVKHATVVFYNVENLFDTMDDPHVNDNEFLPASEKEWTTTRYQEKLDDIAKVLVGINSSDLPEIIGLCEVENRSVLKDLVRTSLMRKGHYKIIHENSPDARGIDVALLYRSSEFKEISHETIPVNEIRTRDILHVFGELGGEKIHLFVNHWPSRVGGLEETEVKRIAVAQILKSKIDELLEEDSLAKIIVMGDMNDEPTNKSLSFTLGAKKEGDGSQLINLMIPLDEQGYGSYNYQGQWNMLDNMIVSSALLNGTGLTVEPTGYIYQDDWMEYENNNGDISPNRTYGGPNYYGGVSDHFPVYLELIK